MKYIIKVAEKSYQVEIENINTRPIQAFVDGELFEVFPEESAHPASTPSNESSDGLQAAKTHSKSEGVPTNASNEKSIIAPLPGNITEVFIKPGEKIEKGQVILVIEAMKMKNSIRSTKSGTIADVLVSVGQTVSHKQILVEFDT